MPQKKSQMRYSACDCNCCMWHNSPTVKILLAIVFLALVVDLAVTVFFGPAGYLTAALSGFVGLILLIVFIGWLISISCTCGGRHWIHGADADPKEIAKIRYSKGEISKKEYSDIIRDLKA
ncbi:MAG: hypothetical protein KGH94_03605 [Candidatus Micrarchaeota archaeon]|nr:hypothetical protein [Candidatus Micrarchaeota archaeon]